ncbi:MAG: aldo/keto reductase [Dehalococcoidales bacterium]|nr:aldo/keto reductase [Dehalococcoidales bacterium]
MRIQKRLLGKTNIEITPIGLGSWQFSGFFIGSAYWGPLKTADIDGIVKASVDSGINWFDTAELYGFGRSEKNLAHALLAAGTSNGDVIIATKWLPTYRGSSSITKTISRRSRCLEPFDIDLYQIHFPNSLSQVEDQMDAMSTLLEQGKIKAAGVSNFPEELLRRANKRITEGGFHLASNQVKYNLLDRSIERNGVFSAAKELGITIIAYSPLQMGLLSGRYHRKPELVEKLPHLRRKKFYPFLERSRPLMTGLERIALDHGVTTSQVALNWLVNFHGDTVVAIPGATSPEQVVQNAASMTLELSKPEMDRIDKLSRDL